MVFNNISLLPHEPDIQIKDIMAKLRYISLLKRNLIIFKEALLSFKSGELHEFDAQVGETLCQIRAYRIAKLSNNYLFEAQIDISYTGIIRAEKKLHEIELELKKISCTHKSTRPEWIKKICSLRSFFEEYGLFFEIPEEIFFIFLSYFLCYYNLTNAEGIPSTINYAAISNTLGVSASYAKKITQYYQKTLSRLSCEYVQTILNQIKGKQELKNSLALLNMLSDEGRRVLPCYSVTDIILTHAIKSKFNIIIASRNTGTNELEILSFKGSEKQQLKPFDLRLSNDDEPCLVFFGTKRNVSPISPRNHLSENIDGVDIKSLILCNNASHPQYSGKTLLHFSHNPFTTLIEESKSKNLSPELQNSLMLLSNELNEMKSLAKILGCTITDQRSFLLKHIFCDTIRRYKSNGQLYATPLTQYSLDEAQLSLAT